MEASIFLRGDMERLGIAPLTSMYWFGKNNRFVAPDWRPEVHDSDGLELHLANGERIWRPLNNPPRPTVNSFAAEGLKGFGLAQRSGTSAIPGRRRLLREARHGLGGTEGRLG